MNPIDNIMKLAWEFCRAAEETSRMNCDREEDILRAAIEQEITYECRKAYIAGQRYQIEQYEQALGQGEPVAYMHCPSVAMDGKVRPVLSFEKYEGDYARGIYSERIPLFAAPQPQRDHIPEAGKMIDDTARPSQDRRIDALLKQAEHDTALLRQALEYLERSVDNYPTGQALSRSCHEDTIAALQDRLK
jgi:hypothetical protein